MSALTNLKSYLLRGAKDEDIKLKEAILDLFLAIDNDLNDADYVPSTDVEEAVEVFDRTLIELGELEDKIIKEDAALVEEAKTGDLSERVKKDDVSE